MDTRSQGSWYCHPCLSHVSAYPLHQYHSTSRYYRRYITCEARGAPTELTPTLWTTLATSWQTAATSWQRHSFQRSVLGSPTTGQAPTGNSSPCFRVLRALHPHMRTCFGQPSLCKRTLHVSEHALRVLNGMTCSAAVHPRASLCSTGAARMGVGDPGPVCVMGDADMAWPLRPGEAQAGTL